MGLRSKILLTFVACFAVMAGLAMTLLHRSMAQSSEVIEKRELRAHMDRVQQALETQLAALNTTTRDWSIWTEMYEYAVKPNAAWAKDNIGPDAMAPADLSLFMVLNKAGKVIVWQTRDPEGHALVLPDRLGSPFMAFFGRDESLPPGCGLLPTDAGLMLSCWAPIRRSDGGGAYVGRNVMGRLLSPDRIERLRDQVALPFNLIATTARPSGLTIWPGKSSDGALGKRDFFTAKEADTYHLYYPVQDLLGQPTGLITLDLTRDVYLQSEQLFQRARRELLWVGLVMASLLFAGIHYLLVHRLRKFEHQLIDLANKSTWETRVSVGGSDELGILAGRVNQLLALIQSQVEKLNTLTLTDPLTGLANRRAFDVTLALEHARELRNGQTLALLLVDVDQFKRYNDHYGHPMGDAALKNVADVLQRSIRRPPDLVARIGGEEFAVLLPETDLQGASQIAHRIRANFQSAAIAHAASAVAPYLTVSIGLAIAADESVDAFVARADQALYEAKAGGRDRLHCAN